MGFLLMLQTLTRIPVNRALPCAPADFRRASAWFVPVGLLLGLMSLGVATLGSWLFGRVLGALAYTLSLVALTGALHHDGLADCFDACFCHRDREGMLAILKDSRMGAYGTLALVFAIAIRTAAAVVLPLSWFPFLACVPMLGRAVIAWIAATGKPARPGGSGALFLGNVPKAGAALGLAAVAAAFALTGGLLGHPPLLPASLGAVLLACAAAWAFRNLLNRRLAGLTGDCLGACSETAELVALVALVAASRFL